MKDKNAYEELIIEEEKIKKELIILLTFICDKYESNVIDEIIEIKDSINKEHSIDDSDYVEYIDLFFKKHNNYVENALLFYLIVQYFSYSFGYYYKAVDFNDKTLINNYYTGKEIYKIARLIHKENIFIDESDKHFENR